MGINARLRYGISWLLIKVFMTATSWVSSGLAMVCVGITWFALWFSPELCKVETIRLLKQLDKD